MMVFLDFEASSLSKHSFPIEIAWVFEDGRSRSSLIKPKPGWTDWSNEAQRIHGISQSLLELHGVTVEKLVPELIEALSGHDLLASSPSWDGKWLSALLRGGGAPRHALRLRKSDDAFAEAAAEILAGSAAEGDIPELVETIIASSEPTVPVHRALPDARLELERLHLVRQAARARLVHSAVR
jgi:hypothetical protein